MRKLPPPPPSSLLKSLWKKSQTKVWAFVQAVSGAGLLTVGEIGKFVTDPTTKDYLSQLDLPKSLTIGLVIFGLVTYLVHGHTDDA